MRTMDLSDISALRGANRSAAFDARAEQPSDADFARAFEAAERDAPRQRPAGASKERRAGTSGGDDPHGRTADEQARTRDPARRDRADAASAAADADADASASANAKADANAGTDADREGLDAGAAEQPAPGEEWGVLALHEPPVLPQMLAADRAAAAAVRQRSEPGLEAALRAWIEAQAGAAREAGDAELLRGAGSGGPGIDAPPGLLALEGLGVDGGALLADLSTGSSTALSTDLSALLATAQTAPGARGPAAMAVPLAPAAPAFPEALAERVRWQLEDGRDTAELRLDPPSLGSLSVRIRLERDEASILFMSAQPGVREALEDALPKLRELLADAGLRLVDVSVGAGSDQGAAGGEGEGQDDGEARRAAGGGAGAASDPDGPWLGAGDAGTTLAGRGLVDAYV